MPTETVAQRPHAVPHHARLISLESIRKWVLGLTMFSSFTLLIEPAPYELLAVATICTFCFTGGLRFTREGGLFIALIFIWIFGAFLSLLQVHDRPNTIMWTVIGVYLALTAVFYGAITAANTEERTRAMLNAYTAGAVVCALIGIAGYFRMFPFSDTLLLYGRAKSTFKDPNVYGPALNLAACWMMVQLCHYGAMRNKLKIVCLAIISLGLFLSFSRAAWVQYVVALLLTMGVVFMLSPAWTTRFRVIVVLGAGCVVAMLGLAVILSIDSVRELFLERASLVQSYDVGQGGRFSAQAEGFRIMLERPFGIGMLQAGRYFGVDPHNSYLNAFLCYGWLGGMVFPALMIGTLVMASKAIMIDTPWRDAFIATYATYLPHVLAAWLIDLDHWRHLYILWGLLWGMSAATIGWVRMRDRAMRHISAR